MSDEASDFAVYAPHYSVVCVTESRCSLRNRIEHRLKLGWRARDHPQDVASRRFSFKRLVALAP
jgi:hypothetical protein